MNILSIVKSNKNVHYRQDLPVSCPVPTYYSTNYHSSEEKYKQQTAYYICTGSENRQKQNYSPLYQTEFFFYLPLYQTFIG